MASKCSNLVYGLKPVIAMVLVQITLAGVNVFYKLAVNDGMSMRVLIAYRFIFATAFVVPLALIFERKNRPRLTWMAVFQGILSGLFGGALAQNLSIEGLALTSATFVTAMANVIPALTFILAIMFRLERLAIRKLGGIVKLMGTLLCVGGAMVFILYKGREINLWSSSLNLIKHNTNHIITSHHAHGNQILGSSLVLASDLCYAIWYVVQAKMGERYPCKYTSTALMCSSASIQTTVYALCTERDWSAWKLGWNIRLLSAVYTGSLATGLMVAVTTWYVRIKGPLYVSIFSPLALVFVALIGYLILDEKLHMGSVVGSALIIIGLYAVLWGKGKERKEMSLGSEASKSTRESETLEVIIIQSGDDQLTSTSTVFPLNDQTPGEMPAANMRRP